MQDTAIDAPGTGAPCGSLAVTESCEDVPRVSVIDAVGEYSCAGTGLTVKLKLIATPADNVDMSLKPDGEDAAAVMLKVAAPLESVVALVDAAVRPVGNVIVTTAAAIGDELPSYRVITTGADPPCGTVVAPARAIFGV